METVTGLALSSSTERIAIPTSVCVRERGRETQREIERGRERERERLID